jgi:hypothetical protein
VTDPVRPSPHPPEPDDDEPRTDPGRAVDVEYLKAKLEEVASLHDRKIRNSGWLRTVVATIGGTGIAIAMFVLFVDNRVRAQTDAGVLVHEQRIVTLEEQRKSDRVEMNGRLERIETNANADHALALGVSQKVDRLLEKFNVPNPAPTPTDGGSR